MSKTYYTTFYPEEDTIGSKGSAAFLAYTAKLTVYKRSLTTPTAPSGGSYNFDGGVLTPPSGWTVDITAGSDPVWESTTNVSTFVRNDVVNTLTWSTPVEILRSGTIGVSPILVSLSRPTVNIMTDSNGNNGIYTNSGTNISVVQGLTTLEYDGVGTSSGTWTISSVVPSNINAGTTAADSASYAIINDHNTISASTASITYNITGKSSSNTAFTTSVTQTFTRLIGAVVDTAPPGQVALPTLSTSTETLAGGSVQVKLKATWTANTEPDISYYEPEIKLTSAGDATYIGYQTATNSYEWIVTAGTSYTVRVRAADKSDNKGVYSTAAALTSGTDSVAPGIPTALTAIATFKNIFLSWTNTNGATDTDLTAVEIWEATTNNSASATKIATVNAVKGAPGAFTRSGITNGTTYYYFLKSVDTSNNISAFTTTNSVATNQTSVTVAIDGVFTLTGNSTGLSLGNVVTVTGTLGGTGTISGYTTGTNYVVSATNGSTTATLVAANGTTLTTTAGTLTGLTFTVVRSAAIPAAVGTSDIIAGSITADRLRVGAITADIIAVPANQATTGGLNSSIQVGTTGISIGTVQADAANPAPRINDAANTTTIQPGKIQISGGITLADWRKGTDLTKIDGGSISANTISANKIQIGSRGVDIAGIQFQAQAANTNEVTWTTGTIVYTNNAGTVVTQIVDSGSTTQAVGTIKYLYWVKPPEGTITATYSGTTVTLTYPLQDSAPYLVGDIIKVSGITATTNAPNGVFTVVTSTTTQTTYTAASLPTGTLAGTIVLQSNISSSIASGNAYRANVIVLATYAGSTDLVVSYGRTIIDGSQITTGTVDANRLKADSIIGNKIFVGGTNFRINGAEQGAGKGTLTVSDGAVDLIKLGYIDATTVGFQIKNTSGETVISSTTTAASINNSNITVNASGQLTGIGTGANTAVANSQITISGGALTGIGTGSGTAVANASITMNSNGSISGAGGGQVTIGGLGYTGALNATYGATFGNASGVGNNISGQITVNNASTFIANAAIGSALIGSIALVGTSNFSVKTSDDAFISRIEMNGQVIKIFEGSQIRVKIGNLAA